MEHRKAARLPGFCVSGGTVGEKDDEAPGDVLHRIIRSLHPTAAAADDDADLTNLEQKSTSTHTRFETVCKH